MMLGMLSGVCNWYKPDGPMSSEEMMRLHLDLAFRALGAKAPAAIKAARRKAA